jgi:alanyl-tRNA synthetase
MYTADQIRRKYIDFFESKGHARIPSASLVPQDDPTVLFTTAGMHPLVPYLMGKPHPQGTRLVDYQKCIRTNDIDEVGDDTHLTFFEMLGNWSLGDYFKEDAIAWSFEFLTSPEWLNIPVEKLAVSVFQGDADAPRDDEAAGIWKRLGIPAHRIVYLPKKDNWWGPAGETGPCGPDTEMFYYRREGLPPQDSNPETDADNWVEIWNDVFMQYNKTPDGSYVPLAQQNVDTGMGLERITAVLQGKDNVFETDLFQSLIAAIAGVLDASWDDPKARRALRIIADHSRAATFVIGDGVKPSNLHRGYVLRRLIRRAIAQARILGNEQPVMRNFAAAVIDQFGETYPELTEKRAQILETLEQEEAAFSKTLHRGMLELQKILDETKGTIDGEAAFRLHDTYGFPIDLTREFAAEHGLTVDMAGFERELDKQKDRSRIGSGFTIGKVLEEEFAHYPKTEFTGYDGFSGQAKVLGVQRQDDDIHVVLDRTPFYGEGGGQMGDKGVLVGPNGTVTVQTTKKTKGDVFVHIGKIQGDLAEGDTVEANVDIPAREQVMRYHTATHLLHKALHDVIGKHAEQRGSSITEKRLRFDFSHDKPLTDEERNAIEAKVNAWIKADLPVRVEITTLDAAKAAGAMALFEGKYDQDVRMIVIGDDVSRELCGGTHVTHTGEIGPVRLTKQESVGGGVRRVRVQ